MELPIDHFRLLGVSPATDAQTVLRTLQQRLEHAPDQGFTLETIRARADLLEASADVLSDPVRRQAYEAELMAIEQGGEGEDVAAGLDVAPSKEIGGLLLLLEAGLAHEAFLAAMACLQPPQAPALGSGREADLCLLAAVACRAAAADLSEQRRYKAAASLLQQGIQLLQRMGQVPEQRRQLASELQALLPYRVLNLLSRPLTETSERAEGLELLESLIRRRGGLEGQDDPDLPQEDFQAFIKQIRLFLTAQEQVDLFSRWAEEGSAAAGFLAGYALTASGFAQRKPERIAAARERLQAAGPAGMEPLLACLHLLLGQIEPAVDHFSHGAGPELKAWAAEQADDPLAQLCAYCRDWLSREVLPGYRDIEVDADLEAYFADRDVQAFVEQQDRRLARGQTPPVRTGDSASAADQAWAMPELDLSASRVPWLEPGVAGAGAPLDPAPATGALEGPATTSRARAAWQGLRSRGKAATGARPGAAVWIALAAAAAVIAGLWLLTRPRPAATPGSPPAAGAGAPQSAKPPGQAKPEMPATTMAAPLRAADPSQEDIQGLLESWLNAKAAVLGGGVMPPSLDQLARPALVNGLRAEALELAGRNERQRITTRVRDLRLTGRSPRRIEAEVRLDYREERSVAGKVVEPATSRELRNIYVFARDGGIWKVADFHNRR